MSFLNGVGNSTDIRFNTLSQNGRQVIDTGGNAKVRDLACKDFKVRKKFTDATGNSGSLGDILSSTGETTEWVPAASMTFQAGSTRTYAYINVQVQYERGDAIGFDTLAYSDGDFTPNVAKSVWTCNPGRSGYYMIQVQLSGQDLQGAVPVNMQFSGINGTTGQLYPGMYVQPSLTNTMTIVTQINEGQTFSVKNHAGGAFYKLPGDPGAGEALVPVCSLMMTRLS